MAEAVDAHATFSNSHPFASLQPPQEEPVLTRAYHCLLTFRDNLWSQPWYMPLRRTAALVLYFIVGCAIFTQYEGWSVGTAISFTIATITTVGFGYHHPTRDGTRLFTVFYMFFGIVFVFRFIKDVVTRNLRKYVDGIIDKVKSTDIDSSYRLNYYLMVANCLAIVLCVVFGAVVFTNMEGWSFIEALYFAVQTSFTVGYGDLELRNGFTHLFLGFYMLFSIILFTFAIENLNILRNQQMQMQNLENLLRKRKELSFLTDLDKGPGVTEDQFVLQLLLYFGKLNYDQDVRPWADKFKGLDKFGQGRIFREDLLFFTAEEREVAAQQIQQLETIRKVHKTFSFYRDVPEMAGREENGHGHGHGHTPQPSPIGSRATSPMPVRPSASPTANPLRDAEAGRLSPTVL